MRFEVCFLPSEATRQPPPVAVLIDVIRASTTIVTLLERGCPEVLLARHADRGQLAGLRERFAPALVCAEDPQGTTTPGADLGPSPAGLRELDLAGRRVVLCTANGTHAAELLRDGGVGHAFIGGLRNARAVMEAAVGLAARLDRSVSLVCAGREACRIPALDDTCAAAVLVRHGQEAARALGRAPVLLESARIAGYALAAFASVRDALERSATAEALRRVGSEPDVAFCAEEAVSRIVPAVAFGARPGVITIRPCEEES